MTNEQKRLLDLLKEINGLCELSGAKYAVVGTQLLFKKSNRNIAGCEFDILMTWHDYSQFKIAFDSNPLPEREIESLENNALMPGWYFRYVDSSTTLFSLDYALVRKAHGVGINIHILRKFSIYHPFLNFIERGLSLQVEKNDDLDQKPNSSGRLSKFAVMLLRKAMGEKRFSCYYSKAYIKTSQNDKNKNGILKMPRNIKVKIPSGFLKRVDLREYSSGEVYVSKKSDKYLKEQYGMRYKSFRPQYRKEDYMNICSVSVPYRLFVPYAKEVVNDNSFWMKRKKYLHLYRRIIRPQEEKQKKRWAYFFMAGDRFSDWKKYAPQKDRIMKLYNCEEYDQLWLLLRQYRIHLERYAKLNIPYSIDSDLWNIVIALYKMNGYGIYADKLSKLCNIYSLPEISGDCFDKYLKNQNRI